MGENGGKGRMEVRGRTDRSREHERCCVACTGVVAVGLGRGHGLKYFTRELSTGLSVCELKEESKDDS